MYYSKLLVLVIIVIILIIFYSYEQKIPKIIWTYWEGPKNTVVKECIKSWKTHIPDYKINIINSKNIHLYMDTKKIKYWNESQQRNSDFVRLIILAKYGGIWMDASIYATKSLEWLNKERKNKGVVGFYLPTNVTNIKYPVIDSWFIACVPKHPFIIKWRDEFMSINKYPSIDSYIEKRKKDTDTQNINNLNYLAIHVSSQYVLQHTKGIVDTLYIKSAFNNGPFDFYYKNGWDSNKALNDLCKDKHKYPLIKFTGNVRDDLNKNRELQECIFSN
jgi:hypothetical protein